MAETNSNSAVENKEKTTQNTSAEPTPVVSATVPIPEPRQPPPGFAEPEAINNNNLDARTYTLQQLKDWGEHPSVQEYKGQLPTEIDRKKLSGALRKRKYPFKKPAAQANQNGQRWKGKETRGDWQQRKNVAQKRDENTEDGAPEFEEERILDVEKGADPNEAAPQWDGDDDEDIKRTHFEFKVLDRDRDHKIFQETGKVPDKPNFMSRQAYAIAEKEKMERLEIAEKNSLEQQQQEQRQKKTIEGSGLDHLFRAAAQSDNLPPVPKDGVKGETLEKKSALGGQQNPAEDGFPNSFYAHPQPDHREHEMPPPGAGSRDPAEELSRPMDERYRQNAHLGDLDFFGSGDPKHSPTREPSKGMNFPPTNTLSTPNQPYDPNNLPSPHQQPVGQSPLNHPNIPQPNSPGGSAANNVSSMSRLDTILYEVTSPVRPCVGGAFFANVRPLSNKELYDYSPKFKEIQDTRLKRQKFAISRHAGGMPPLESEVTEQMRQHQAHHAYHRKRMMMQKYAHAKKMYAEHAHLPKYPAQQDRYGGHMIEYGGRSLAHGMDYRRRERPDYDMHYEMMRSRRL